MAEAYGWEYTKLLYTRLNSEFRRQLVSEPARKLAVPVKPPHTLRFGLRLACTISKRKVRWSVCGRLRLKCDGTRADTRFRLSAKRMSPFKLAGRQFSRLMAAEVDA